jgi:hypothetical protein
MAKRVAFTDQAKAELRAIPQPIAIQILRTLARFLESEEGNVRRLQGVDPPLYRLRTQDHASSSATSGAISSKSPASATAAKLTAEAVHQRAPRTGVPFHTSSPAPSIACP